MKIREGLIGPPIAHIVGVAGLLSMLGLTHVLELADKAWSVVLILAGFAIPFALARELVAKRKSKP
jgi:hypothetical protein